ncbi:Atlastin-1 [Halotydeus destructor]|nr:Atlastin-1 [Halotydeus destructor]KAI1286280.1 Atlastin-1 [Halotydeus destructor]
MNAQPKTVLSLVPDAEHGWKLEPDYDELDSILCHESCRDKEVCVVSIVGSARKGKSVMMNWMLQHLQASSSSDWLQDLADSNKGFPWQGGSESTTMGILMWSQPFIVQQDGREVAVFLMDTQGLFDGKLSTEMTARLFVISTVMSSVQIFNLKSDIQDDTLQYLKTFTDYAVQPGVTSGPSFQKLVFLIRDMEYPNYKYGFNEGQRLLDTNLAINGGGPDIVHVRQNIRDTFEELECFLLPHPGNALVRSVDQLCPLSRIEPSFLAAMMHFVERTLDPDNLVVKSIESHNLTGFELFNYVRSSIDLISENNPLEEAISRANQIASCAKALRLAHSRFEEEMLLIFGSSEPGFSDDEFEQIATRITRLALDVFNDNVLSHRHETYENSRQELMDKVASSKAMYKSLNDAKNYRFDRAFQILKDLIALFKKYFFGSGSGFFGTAALVAILTPVVTAGMASGATLAAMAAALVPLITLTPLSSTLWSQLIALFVSLMYRRNGTVVPM